jgi:Mg-chelatase subunit ChlD
MSNLELKSQVAAASSRINALMSRLQERSGKPLETKKRGTRLVYLLLDCSGSMEGEKMSQAKIGALSFARDAFQKGYGVGLVTFASTAHCLAEAQPGCSLRPAHLESLASGGGTNIGAAIHLAREKLQNLSGEKVICVVSDGGADRTETFRARDQARAAGIEIMTLGVDGADMDFLNELATRQDLSVYVPTSRLPIGMQSMVKLLP